MERNPKAQGEEAHGERASPYSHEQLSSPKLEAPSKSRGATKSYKPNQCWQHEGVGHLKKDCPTLKGKGLFPGENALTSLKD